MTKYNISGVIPKTECLIVPVFEGQTPEAFLKPIDPVFFPYVQYVATLKDFTGKKLQQSVIFPGDELVDRIMYVGLGKEKDFTIHTWKQVVGAATISLQDRRVDTITFFIPDSILEKFEAELLSAATVAAVEVAAYKYDRYKTEADAKAIDLKQITIVGKALAKDKRRSERGVLEGQQIGEAANMVRELGNTPPSIMTPEHMAEAAQKISKEYPEIHTTILSLPQIKKLKMGCFLGVAKGSDYEPKFIIMEYWGGRKTEKPVVLIGKGVTFDSGGLSIKPTDFMINMKYDMLGGAAVMGTIQAAAALKLKRNIVSLIPACENMPSGKAYRPDDILTAMNGTTVEVGNTDAEGRLILSDAICYAHKFQPKEIIDLATLTGACMVALGTERAGLFANDDNVAARYTAAASAAGEEVWRLPLGEEYSEAIKSDIADIQNVGGVGHPRYAGASTGAAFLQVFVKDVPWAHLDLSSCYSDRGRPWIRSGANGYGVATLIEYLRK